MDYASLLNAVIHVEGCGVHLRHQRFSLVVLQKLY